MLLRLMLLSLMLCAGQAFAFEEPNELPSNIKVEPTYTGESPRYAMAVFGAKNEKAIWMVLDKTERDSEVYNKLYVDLNCNGDLTEPDELFSLLDEDGKNKKLIELPDVSVSNDSEFTKVIVSVRKAAIGECMFKAVWNDEIRFGGGYPEVTKNGYMRFAETQADAPTVFFKGNAPFEFQPWFPKPLKIGSETTFKVFLGHRGKGYSSFCTSLGHILAEDEPVLATLNYVDADGNKKRADVKLTERC